MATTTTITKTVNSTLLTTQLVQSTAAAAGAGILVGAVMDVSAKMAATLNVIFIRTAAASNTGATQFRIEHSPAGGAAGPWVPLLYPWTTSKHSFVSNLQTLNSNAAAGATSFQLSAALGSALSDPIGVYNSAAPGLSEINYQKMASTNPSLNWSLTGAQTSGVAIATSYAEMWCIPLDLSAVTDIRLVVDNVWSGVTSPVVVGATMTFTDSLLNT